MYRIITKVINKNKFNSKLFCKKEIKKTISAETIEDKEEYFVMKIIKIQDNQKNQMSIFCIFPQHLFYH